jgi:hypothetical protein
MRCRPSPVATLVVACAALCACGGPLSDARAEFDRGHYAAARQLLAPLDHPGRWVVSDRATYALYRGLTCGALGDVGRARAWLLEARALEQDHPGSLPAEDDRRLRVALRTYEVGP